MKKNILFLVAIFAVFALTKEAIVAQEAQVSRSIWQVGCGETVDGKGVCQIQRDIKHGNGKDLVARLFIVRGVDKKDASIRFLMPLDVNLPYGVRYAVTVQGKRSETAGAVYQNCSKDGCLAAAKFSKPLADAMLAGKTLHIGFATKDLKGIEINIDLNGFSVVHQKFVKGV